MINAENYQFNCVNHEINTIKQTLTVIFLCLITTTLHVGEVVEVISKDLTAPNKAAETLKFLFSDGFMKMSADEENDVVFNSDERNMLVISHDEKTYLVFDENTASNIKSEIDKAMEEALSQATRTACYG